MSHAQHIIPFRAHPQKATFRRRYKRFLADITWPNGRTQTVHVPNPGRMTSCIFENAPCLVTKSPRTSKSQRQYAHTLEAIFSPTGWIGLNTHNANRVAETLIRDRFTRIRKEKTVAPGWRADYVAFHPELNKDIILEVKNVSYLASPNVAAFPDSPSERARRQLKAMGDLLRQGQACGILFVIQRDDVTAFHPAHWIDAEFARLFWDCLAKGLWLFIARTRVSPAGFTFDGAIPLIGSFTP